MSFNDDLDPRDFERREAADRSVYVKFYIHPVMNQFESDKAGRPIYVDKEYIEIRTPGQQNNVVQRPVQDSDKQRFRAAYAKFKEGETEQVVGTPLTEVPWITRSQVEELYHVRIRTLEHLASVNDSVCAGMAGLTGLKQKAIRAVEAASKQAPLTEMQAQINELRNLVESQRVTIEEQSEVIRGLQTKATQE